MPAPPNLATITRDGRRVDVVAACTKIGNTLLLDRTEEAESWAETWFKSATAGWFLPCTEGRANLFWNIDGGAEWTGACVDPETGRLYVTANHVGWLISLFRDGDPPDDPRAPRTPGQVVFETACAQCHGTNRMGIATAPPLRGLRFRADDAFVTNQVRVGKNAMPAPPDMSEAEIRSKPEARKPK